jgi:hypothetical protein
MLPLARSHRNGGAKRRLLGSLCSYVLPEQCHLWRRFLPRMAHRLCKPIGDSDVSRNGFTFLGDTMLSSMALAFESSVRGGMHKANLTLSALSPRLRWSQPAA